jgi:flavin-binding protein dodecin
MNQDTTMQEHVWKLLEPAGHAAMSMVDVMDKAIKRSNKTLEATAGFRRAKRAAFLAMERFTPDR